MYIINIINFINSRKKMKTSRCFYHGYINKLNIISHYFILRFYNNPIYIISLLLIKFTI